MKRNGFTLIELLVVVAIIGILAAVGVVAYNGYTSAAKVNSVKTNHVQSIKYTKSELMKCSMGENSIMEGHVICNKTYGVNVFHPNGLGAQKVAEALVNVKAYRSGGYDWGVLKGFKNPYNTSNNAVASSGSFVAGQVSVSSSGSTVTIKTCTKSGCASADQLTATVNVD